MPTMSNRSEAFDVDGFLASLGPLLTTALPNQEFSLYLLGSHADASAIATSDLDLALLFPGAIAAETRTRAQDASRRVQEMSPVAIDMMIAGADNLAGGVMPKLKSARLLAGHDIIQSLPVKPKPELMLYHTGFVMHFVQAIRGNPKLIDYPLAYPGTGEFHGYEINGIRTSDGRYVAGFNMLVNLVLTIGTFRLAWFADVFTPNKSSTAAEYRRSLPEDPWCDLMEDVHRICRVQWEGQVPASREDRARIAEHCARVVDLENDCLNIAILHLDEWLPAKDPTFQMQVLGLLKRVKCASSVHAAKLEAIQARWQRTP